MTAKQLWESMANGGSWATITEKQRTYLVDLAREERIFYVTDTTVRFPDGVVLTIRKSKDVPGKFKVEQTRVWK